MKKNAALANCRWGLFKKKHYLLNRNRRLFFISTVLFMLLASCDNDTFFIKEEHDIIEEEISCLNPDLQPFAAWLRSTTPGVRSSIDPEIGALIEHEKELFATRFSYIQEFFKIVPNPRWETPKMIQYDKDVLDIFILCGNTYAEKIFENDLALIISRRGEDVFSYIKMLPRDESLADRLTAVYHEDKVYLEIGHTGPDGAITTQNVGFISRDETYVRSATRNAGLDCWEEVTLVLDGMIITSEGDGKFNIESITHEQRTLVCSGSSGGVSVPPAGAGVGSIPPYTSPFTSGSGGSGDIRIKLSYNEIPFIDRYS